MLAMMTSSFERDIKYVELSVFVFHGLHCLLRDTVQNSLLRLDLVLL